MGALEEYLNKKKREIPTSILQVDEEGEEDKKSHPMAHVAASELPGLLYGAAKEGLKAEAEKPWGEIAKDVAYAPVAAVKAVARGVLQPIAEGLTDPRRAIAPIAQVAGTALGALGGNPATMIAGSIAGRAAGEAVESWIFNRPLLNAESALETVGASFGSVIGQVAGGAARGALRTSGKIAASDAGRTLAPTTITRPELPTVPGQVEVEGASMTAIMARRQSYAEQVRAEATNTPVYNFTRVNAPNSPYKTVYDVVKYQVDNGEDVAVATKLALQHEIQKRTALDEAARIAGTPVADSKELLRLRAEVSRITNNEELAKINNTPQQLTTYQGKVAKGMKTEGTIDGALAEELARFNDDTLKSLPDYLHQDVDTFRRMVEVLPEATQQPLLKAGEKIVGPGVFRKFQRLQYALRKHNDPHLTHTADMLVAADETHKGMVQHFVQKSRDFFKANPLGDVDKVYLQTLERNEPLFMALKQLDGPVQNPQQVVSHLDTVLQGHGVAVDEVPQLLKAYGTIRGWQREVGDPMYTLGLKLAKDAGTLPPIRPTYFTSTFTEKAQLDELKDQLVAIDTLAKKTPNGPLAQRYAESREILKQKIAIGQKAVDAEASKLRNWKFVLNRDETPLPTSVFAAELQKKKGTQGIGLNIEEASEHYVHNMAKKIVYDRLRESGDATIKAWMDAAMKKGGDVKAIHSTARFVQNAILDQTGTRRAVAMQRIMDTLESSPLTKGIAPHMDKALKTITSSHYLLNVAMKPAFHALNASQSFLTLMPLVDTESFSQGIMKALLDYPNAYKEAADAGALAEGLNQLWKDSPGETGITRAIDASLPVKFGQKIENINRVIAFQAGKHNAEINGITGHAALKRGVDVSTESNFLYSAAYRPQIMNTPIPAHMMMYKSFSINYGNYIANLVRKGETSRVAAALAATFAMSGTTGLPLYSWVRGAAASQGIVLPEVKPLDEMTGVELQGADAPWPLLPMRVDDMAGPIGNLAIDAGRALMSGEEQDWATVGKDIVGGGVMNVAQGVAEIARGGRTYGPGGRLRSERTPEQIGLSMVGFGPNQGKLNYQARTNISIAAQAKDALALRRAVEESQGKGVRNQRDLIAATRSKVRRGENESIIGQMFGYDRK
jgi:hypothetical protein